MTKLIALCSLVVVLVGYCYSRSNGFIISLDSNGTRIYSDSLQSSGGDDAYLMSLGFASFSITFASSVLAFLKKLSERNLKIIYLTNLSILFFDIYLVNLDVSVIDSMKFGDALLLVGLMSSVLPVMFLVIMTIANKSIQHSR